jgi:pectate lyase-like protein
VFNIKRFGAVGDGTTDDTGAFQAAVNALPPSGGKLYFPAGIYKLTHTVNITDKPVALCGDGMNISVLRWTGQGMAGHNGIEYAASQQRIFTMYDLSLEAVPSLTTGTALAGSAIKLTYPAQQSVFETTIQFQRVYFSPLRTGNTWNPTLTGGWTTCVEGIDANYPNITDCTFLGTGLGTKGVSLSSNWNPDYIVIAKCNFIGMETAIVVNGPNSIGGLVVEGCDILSVGVGINITVPADLLQVYGSYFKVAQNGIVGLARNSLVNNNRFDAGDSTLYTATSVEGVHIGNSLSGPYDGNIITNNTFNRNSVSPFDGIVLDQAVVFSSVQVILLEQLHNTELRCAMACIY